MKSINLEWSMWGNGKMGSLMELANCFFKMVLTFMELLQMGSCMEKDDSFQQINHTMKDKSDTMWHKEKDYM